jgi:Uma2 family endonuclease
MTTVMPIDSSLTWYDVLRIWCELDVPEGWRPEVTTEGITMTPPPASAHNIVAERLHRMLVAVLNPSFGVYQTLGVAVPSVKGIYMPDLCVVPEKVLLRNPGPVDSTEVLLAVEITSRGNATDDRRRKKAAYARGGIQQYLLIDAYDKEGSATWLYRNPGDDEYGDELRTPFGGVVNLAAPVAAKVDTGVLVRGAAAQQTRPPIRRPADKS